MVRSKTTTNNVTTIVIIVAIVLTGLPYSKAQSPVGSPKVSPMGAPMMPSGSPTASAPAPDCLTVLANVSDCLSYVQAGSNLTVPDKACCPEFAGLLDGNPICLCQLIGNPESLGIDLNRALMLPDACKVAIPPLDACPASPIPAPTSSEAPAPATASTEGPMPDGGTPASGSAGGSGASTTPIHDLPTLICLTVASFIAYYF